MAPNKKRKATLKSSPYFDVKKEEDIKIKLEENLSLDQQEDKGVPDLLDYDLKVLFVGINPGLTSAARGHHYAGPTNHFWPCLSESGLVDRKLIYSDDASLPSLYRLGFTNLTARTTRKASDLSLAEQKDGIPVLDTKIETLRPRVACFVGKGIYEIYSKKKCKVMGLQDQAIPWFFQELNKVAKEQDLKYPLT
ncbi:hypothetical protein MFLAVUS_011169 [Mucor flavus]|uniref:Uracil-DNA glycosylase-like domain-containing protein n=1 Tax=Mucor flavus TaxID=439312 RepID=A0ABP9ZEX3_9FUNG